MELIKMAIIVLGVSGFLFAVILVFLSKKLKVEEDPRIEEILKVLPGLNCGACGFSGCRPFAEAVVKEGKIFSGCLPGGSEVNNKISRLLNIKEGVAKKSQVVVCRCGAKENEKKASSQYQGPQTCRAAHLTGGVIDCLYGCLGLGDCIKVCPVGALSLKDKKIYVDITKCIGCGQCQKICPRNLFEMIPFRKDMRICYVACNNPEKVKGVKSVCSRGCIGCGLCTRVENSPYYLKGNLSYLDYSQANDIKPLLESKNKCPTKCIFEINV